MYREFASSVPGVACAWHRRHDDGGDALVVPDGCVDVVSYGDGRLVLAGPDTAPWHSPVAPEDDVVGIRFATGVARGLLGVPLVELRDQRVDVADLAVTFAVTGSAEERRRALVAHVAPRLGRPDLVVQQAVLRLRRRPAVRVAQLADDLGVSERLLHRRFVDQVGYGPKMFARVARLQRVVELVHLADLADIAYAAGYASQSHLADEVRALTGTTAVRFLEDRFGRAA